VNGSHARRSSRPDPLHPDDPLPVLTRPDPRPAGSSRTRPADRFPTMTPLADALDAHLLNTHIPPSLFEYLASHDETVLG
jgi:hypothetical protein